MRADLTAHDMLDALEGIEFSDAEDDIAERQDAISFCPALERGDGQARALKAMEEIDRGPLHARAIFAGPCL